LVTTGKSRKRIEPLSGRRGKLAKKEAMPEEREEGVTIQDNSSMGR
jgi:hypothetical protein